MSSIIEQIEALVEESELLSEKGSKRNPFKNKSKLGPGPRGRTNQKTDDWDCDCDGYQCKCKHKDGGTKTIKIKKNYKKKYNKQYKKWRKSKKESVDHFASGNLMEARRDHGISIAEAIDIIKTPGAKVYVSVRVFFESDPIWVKAVQRDLIGELKKVQRHDPDARVGAELVNGDVYVDSYAI